MSVINFNLTAQSFTERAKLIQEIQAQCTRAEKGENIDLKQTVEKLAGLVQQLNKDREAINTGIKITPEVRKEYDIHKRDVTGLNARVKALSAKANITPAWVKPVVYTALTLGGIAFSAFIVQKTGILSSPPTPQPPSTPPHLPPIPPSPQPVCNPNHTPYHNPFILDFSLRQDQPSTPTSATNDPIKNRIDGVSVLTGLVGLYVGGFAASLVESDIVGIATIITGAFAGAALPHGLNLTIAPMVSKSAANGYIKDGMDYAKDNSIFTAVSVLTGLAGLYVGGLVGFFLVKSSYFEIFKTCLITLRDVQWTETALTSLDYVAIFAASLVDSSILDDVEMPETSRINLKYAAIFAASLVESGIVGTAATITGAFAGAALPHGLNLTIAPMVSKSAANGYIKDGMDLAKENSEITAVSVLTFLAGLYIGKLLAHITPAWAKPVVDTALPIGVIAFSAFIVHKTGIFSSPPTPQPPSTPINPSNLQYPS